MRKLPEYVADQRMQRLGLPKWTGSANPLAFVEFPGRAGELSNFFEREVGLPGRRGGTVRFDEEF